MSLRTQQNLRKTGYDNAENRGNLPVICPAYCEKCHRIFMPETCTDKTCKKCKEIENE